MEMSQSSNTAKAYRILSYESKKIQKEAIPLDEAIMENWRNF